MERINWPTVDELNNLDMTPVIERVPKEDLEFIGYIKEKAGQEHYRFLTWLGNYFNNTEIVEVGVLKGCSGLALSLNKTNNITGFDIINGVTCSMPANYKFINDDCRNYPDIIKKAKLIFYDTAHDGIAEKQFMSLIKDIQYKGIIVFDDIYYNEAMVSFWKELTFNYPSINVSRFGHCTGTGIIWV